MGQRYPLDDDGFTVLGNALCLGYRVQFASEWFSTTEERRERQDARKGKQRCVTESRELRDALEGGGSLEPTMEQPYDLANRYEPEGLPSIATRWNQVLLSDAPIANIRFKDLDVPSMLLDLYGGADPFEMDDPLGLRAPVARLGALMDGADRWSMQTPIARAGVTDLTRAWRIVVLDWISGRIPQSLGLTRNEWLSQTAENIWRADRATLTQAAAPIKPMSVHPDDVFVSRGLELLKSGKARSANAAARLICEEFGFKQGQAEANREGSVCASSFEQGVDRLGRKIREKSKG